MTRLEWSAIIGSIAELEALREFAPMPERYLPMVDRSIWRLKRVTDAYEKKSNVGRGRDDKKD